MTKIATTREAEAVTPAPIAIGAPSQAARAMAFDRGADLVGLMAQLGHGLCEIRRAVETIIALTPPDDPGLRPLQSFLRRVCAFLGEVSAFSPI